MKKMEDRVAILVVSHNNPELTNSLCENIIKRTNGVEYDLYVIETGSDTNMMSKYTSLWVSDKCRMTRGFNLLKQYADFKIGISGKKYSAYHLFVNDAHFIDNSDMTSILYNQMKILNKCGQIHPYQSNINKPHETLNKVNDSGSRIVSYVEIICPLISAELWNKIPNLLDNIFYYGWGIDYDMSYQIHKEGYFNYISDDVGIQHTAFTSYRDRHITKESLNQQTFISVARNDMNKGFINKYGENWRQILYDGIPEGVSKIELYSWLHHNDGFILK